MKNKKASMIDIIILMIIAFAVVMFFGLWVFGFNMVTEELTSIESNSDSVNISDAAEKTFGQINDAQTPGLHILAYVIILSMGLSILISNFLVKGNPVFLVVYILVVIAAIMGSVYISNQYEEFLQNEIFGSTLADFGGGSFLLLNLPVLVTIIGLLGAIFLFMGIIRDAGLGGSVI